MQPPEYAQVEREARSGAREHPWLFNFLIAPDAVISLGLVGGGLSYLLRNEGVGPDRSASIIALLSLPHAIYFLWGPVTDFWMRRRTWLMTAAAATALGVLCAFQMPRLASPQAVWVLFASACLGVIVAAACGGMMGALGSETNRRRAGSFYQSGSLVAGGITVFLLVSLARRASLGVLGWVVAGLIVLPALAALAAPAQEVVGEHTARETAARIWREFRSTFLRWDAIPYALLIMFPMSSGGMLGLLPGLARDYGVSGAQVAWLNGLGGALITAAGAVAAAWIPVRFRAPIVYLSVGFANAASLAILALGPLRPEVYFAGTVLFLFTIGSGYALFTAVALEFLGDSGKSGSSRYAIINSLGNLPVAYMSFIDGRGYAHWGTRGMPGIDAILSAAGATLMLVYFLFWRTSTASRLPVSASRPPASAS